MKQRFGTIALLVLAIAMTSCSSEDPAEACTVSAFETVQSGTAGLEAKITRLEEEIVVHKATIDILKSQLAAGKEILPLDEQGVVLKIQDHSGRVDSRIIESLVSQNGWKILKGVMSANIEIHVEIEKTSFGRGWPTTLTMSVGGVIHASVTKDVSLVDKGAGEKEGFPPLFKKLRVQADAYYARDRSTVAGSP